jgi:hypothetical protein
MLPVLLGIDNCILPMKCFTVASRIVTVSFFAMESI